VIADLHDLEDMETRRRQRVCMALTAPGATVNEDRSGLERARTFSPQKPPAGVVPGAMLSLSLQGKSAIGAISICLEATDA
jgi:hypothetical protein